MLTGGRLFKALCWLCVGLALTTCMYDACLAQNPEEEATPDSLGVEIEDLEASEDLLLDDTPADSINDGDGITQPIYRKWWVWALVTTAIAVTAVLVGGSGAKETEEDLPGFPDPPAR
jgi:hypothetical protein